MYEISQEITNAVLEAEFAKLTDLLTIHPEAINDSSKWIDGVSPLHWAVSCLPGTRYMYDGIVTLLIKKGANLTTPHLEHGIPLVMAVKSGYQLAIDQIFAHPAMSATVLLDNIDAIINATIPNSTMRKNVLAIILAKFFPLMDVVKRSDAELLQHYDALATYMPKLISLLELDELFDLLK